MCAQTTFSGLNLDGYMKNDYSAVLREVYICIVNLSKNVREHS